MVRTTFLEAFVNWFEDGGQRSWLAQTVLTSHIKSRITTVFTSHINSSRITTITRISSAPESPSYLIIFTFHVFIHFLNENNNNTYLLHFIIDKEVGPLFIGIWGKNQKTWLNVQEYWKSYKIFNNCMAYPTFFNLASKPPLWT